MDSAHKRSLADWARTQPKIRRAWLLGGNRIGLEVQPVADSDETLGVWMAKGGQWKAELQARVGPVDVETLEPDVPAGESAPRELIYERAAE